MTGTGSPLALARFAGTKSLMDVVSEIAADWAGTAAILFMLEQANEN